MGEATQNVTDHEAMEQIRSLVGAKENATVVEAIRSRYEPHKGSDPRIVELEAENKKMLEMHNKIELVLRDEIAARFFEGAPSYEQLGETDKEQIDNLFNAAEEKAEEE